MCLRRVMTRQKPREFAANLFRLGRKPVFVMASLQRAGLRASKASVYRWAAQHRDGRPLETRPAGSGRPRKLTAQQRRQLRAATQQRGFTARKWARERGLNRQTVCNELKRMNLNARICQRTVMLRPANIEKRLAFARRYGTKPMAYWRRCTFSDSKWFTITAKGRQWVWVTAGTKPPTVPKCDRYAPKVHVYAGINVKGVSDPIIIPPNTTVDATVYTEDVLPSLIAFSKQSLGRNHVFQQDGAKPHTARVTRQWLADSADVGEHMGPDIWPPQSPDLNCIEHLWSVLAERVALHRPTTRAGLVRALRAEFPVVETAMCRRLVESMPKRLDEVVARNGLPLARGSCRPAPPAP